MKFYNGVQYSFPPLRFLSLPVPVHVHGLRLIRLNPSTCGNVIKYWHTCAALHVVQVTHMTRRPGISSCRRWTSGQTRW
jgi:hypothetical protein